jgi:outer membrane immunogenic protein
MDRFMPYITGGLAVGDIETSRTGFGTASTTKAGWTLGGGIEAAVAQNWTAKFEYLYVDLGSAGCSAASCGIASNTDFRAHTLRAGLNFRF